MENERDQKEWNIIQSLLQDSVDNGLETEVVMFALQYMKNHPDEPITSAMAYGYDEWIK